MRKVMVAVVAALFVGALGEAMGQKMGQKSDSSVARELETARGMEILLSVYRDANLFYVDSTKPDKMVQDALSGMLGELDPYTEYIPAKDMSDFEYQVTGKYGGIGSLIRQRGLGAKSWVEIAEPYEGTPSVEVGLRAGDRLLEIDGVSLQGLGSPKVSAMLKGDPDTKFTLKYRPIADTTTTREVVITRRKITVPSVPYAGMVSNGVGYVRLNSFIEGSAREVREAIDRLAAKDSLHALILDLRGNGGGSVGEAIDIVGLFVPRGTKALSIKGRVAQSSATYRTRVEPTYGKLPLAVLVNSISASSSEITAGALQDLDRAVIIGQRSFGKGLVQSPRPAPYNGIFKVTTAKYYTPSGRCIQALDYTHRREDGSVGVVPDSLIKSFATAAGRKVYDGGGVMPDVKLEPEYISKFGVILAAYGFIDDFANLYAAQHPKAEKHFVVSDKMYEDFVRFMADKEIAYESMSSQKLKELVKAAEREKYDDKIADELKSIASKIKDDKMEELRTFADQIKDLIASAVVTRWSFVAGAIEHSLSQDSQVQRAVQVLGDKAEYERILTSQDTEKN
ncbi:MAG: S41 family peptidase [Mucinivorans sp.]